MKPTRVVKRTKGKSNSWLWKCDDGVTYTTKELSQIVGFTAPHGLTQRVKTLGFDHPDVLLPPAPKGFKIDGSSVNDGRLYGNFSRYAGEKSELTKPSIGEYAMLGDRSRPHNLAKIPKPGTWERKQL